MRRLKALSLVHGKAALALRGPFVENRARGNTRRSRGQAAKSLGHKHGPVEVDRVLRENLNDVSPEVRFFWAAYALAKWLTRMRFSFNLEGTVSRDHRPVKEGFGL